MTDSDERVFHLELDAQFLPRDMSPMSLRAGLQFLRRLFKGVSVFGGVFLLLLLLLGAASLVVYAIGIRPKDPNLPLPTSSLWPGREDYKGTALDVWGSLNGFTMTGGGGSGLPGSGGAPSEFLTSTFPDEGCDNGGGGPCWRSTTHSNRDPGWARFRTYVLGIRYPEVR